MSDQNQYFFQMEEQTTYNRDSSQNQQAAGSQPLRLDSSTEALQDENLITDNHPKIQRVRSQQNINGGGLPEKQLELQAQKRSSALFGRPSSSTTNQDTPSELKNPQSRQSLQSPKKRTMSKKPTPFCQMVVVFGFDSNQMISGPKISPGKMQVLATYPPENQNNVQQTQYEENDCSDFIDRLDFICFPDENQHHKDQGQSGSNIKQIEVFNDDPFWKKQDESSSDGSESNRELEQANTEEIRLPDSLNFHSYFHFITTNAVGDQKFLTSLTFKELVLCDQGAFLVPKSISVISKMPVFNLHRQLLQLIFVNVIQHNSENSLRAYRQYMASIEGGNFPSEFNRGSEFSQYVIANMMKSSLKQGPQIEGKNILCSRAEFYISLFCNYFHYDQKVQRDIQIDGLQDNHIISYRNTRSFEFNLENYNFEMILQTLTPDNIIMLFTALLLERKIVLIKKEVGEIAIIMQSLITLLKPFKWNFITITYLTSDLAEYLDAPLPYLVGVSTQTWEQICSIKEYPEDIIIFDLESQERKLVTKIDLPELPKPHGDQMQEQFKEIIYRKDKRIQDLIQQSNDTLTKAQCEELFWADAQLSVKQLFFNFFISTLDNYIRFFRPISIDKHSQAFKSLSIQELFDMESFVKWHEAKNKNSEFIRQLVATQAFSVFIEQSSQLKTNKRTWLETQEGYFELNVKFYLENSLKKLIASQQELIDQSRINKMKPVRFKLSGILKMYEDVLLKRNKGAKGQNLDKIDDLVMNYMFAEADGQKQLSLLNGLKEGLMVNQDELPTLIQYNLVEEYWKRKYLVKRSKSPQGQNQAAKNQRKKNSEIKQVTNLQQQDSRRIHTQMSIDSTHVISPQQLGKETTQGSLQLFKRSRNSGKKSLVKKKSQEQIDGDVTLSSAVLNVQKKRSMQNFTQSDVSIISSTRSINGQVLPQTTTKGYNNILMQRQGAKTAAQELRPDQSYGANQEKAKPIKRTKFDKNQLKRAASPDNKLEKASPVLEQPKPKTKISILRKSPTRDAPLESSLKFPSSRPKVTCKCETKNCIHRLTQNRPISTGQYMTASEPGESRKAITILRPPGNTKSKVTSSARQDTSKLIADHLQAKKERKNQAYNSNSGLQTELSKGYLIKRKNELNSSQGDKICIPLARKKIQTVTNFNVNQNKGVSKVSIDMFRTPPNQGKMIVTKQMNNDQTGSKISNILGTTVRFQKKQGSNPTSVNKGEKLYQACNQPGRLTAHNGRRSPSMTDLALAMENSSNQPQSITAKMTAGIPSGPKVETIQNFNSTQKVMQTIETLLPTHNTQRPFSNYGPKKTPNLQQQLNRGKLTASNPINQINRFTSKSPSANRLGLPDVSSQISAGERANIVNSLPFETVSAQESRGKVNRSSIAEQNAPQNPVESGWFSVIDDVNQNQRDVRPSENESGWGQVASNHYQQRRPANSGINNERNQVIEHFQFDQNMDIPQSSSNIQPPQPTILQQLQLEQHFAARPQQKIRSITQQSLSTTQGKNELNKLKNLDLYQPAEIEQNEVLYDQQLCSKNISEQTKSGKPKTSLDSLLNSGKAKTLRFSMVPTPQQELETRGENINSDKTQQIQPQVMLGSSRTRTFTQPKVGTATPNNYEFQHRPNNEYEEQKRTSGVSLLGKTMGLAETAGKTLSSFLANTIGKGVSPDESSQRKTVSNVTHSKDCEARQDTTLLDDYLDNSLTPARQVAIKDVTPFSRNQMQQNMETEQMKQRRTTQIIPTRTGTLDSLTEHIKTGRSQRISGISMDNKKFGQTLRAKMNQLVGKISVTSDHPQIKAESKKIVSVELDDNQQNIQHSCEDVMQAQYETQQDQDDKGAYISVTRHSNQNAVANNGSAFSKIATHLGDVDNDPSTPVSNSSFSQSSGDKTGVIAVDVAVLNETLFRGGSLGAQNTTAEQQPSAIIAGSRGKKRQGQPKQKMKMFEQERPQIATSNFMNLQPDSSGLNTGDLISPSAISNQTRSGRSSIINQLKESMHSHTFSATTVNVLGPGPIQRHFEQEYKEANSFEMTGASEVVESLRECPVVSSKEKNRQTGNQMSKFAPKKAKLFENTHEK